MIETIFFQIKVFTVLFSLLSNVYSPYSLYRLGSRVDYYYCYTLLLGRTGTCIASWLMFSGQFKTAEVFNWIQCSWISFQLCIGYRRSSFSVLSASMYFSVEKFGQTNYDYYMARKEAKHNEMARNLPKLCVWGASEK